MAMGPILGSGRSGRRAPMSEINGVVFSPSGLTWTLELSY